MSSFNEDGFLCCGGNSDEGEGDAGKVLPPWNGGVLRKERRTQVRSFLHGTVVQ